MTARFARYGVACLVCAAVLGTATITSSAGTRPGASRAATLLTGEPMLPDGFAAAPLQDSPTASATATPQASPTASAAEQPQPYAFFPQAGLLWNDLYIFSFVDVDPSSASRDWNCTNFTSNGRRGHESHILGFTSQAIGVPVFAALDGIVVEGDANDGSPLLNHVVLQHAGSHRTGYHHLEEGSVSVSLGQFVRAGTQIGLTGSSGQDTWPHLRFESTINDRHYEPFAGPCRPGPSYWVDQPQIPSSTVVREVAFSETPFEGRAALPWDEVDRTGTLHKKTGPFYIRVQIGSVPPQSSYVLSLAGPNGVKQPLLENEFGNDTWVRATWFWWGVAPSLSPGRWRLKMSVNDEVVVRAPFTVVRKRSAIVNRPPKPVELELVTTGDGVDDALICRVASPTLLRDPDYDLVRYDYTWKVDGAVVRSLQSAAMSDMLPAGTAVSGSTVTCRARSSDGDLSARSTTATLS